MRAETHVRYGTNPSVFQLWVLDQLEPFPGCALLDAGCGYGHAYHAALAERGVTPVGLDRSLGMLREAAPGCHPVQGDLVALPFHDATFDRVMCNHVLYHVADRRAALLELRRVTRPGGRVVLATNSLRTMESLHEVTAAAALEAGDGSRSERRNPFRLEDLDDVGAVFANAVERERKNELVFPDAAGVVAYVASTGQAQEGFLDAVRRRVEEIIAREGAFRTVSISGCFVADV